MGLRQRAGQEGQGRYGAQPRTVELTGVEDQAGVLEPLAAAPEAD